MTGGDGQDLGVRTRSRSGVINIAGQDVATFPYGYRAGRVDRIFKDIKTERVDLATSSATA